MSSNIIDEAESLVAQSEQMRERLLAERHELLRQLDELDEVIARLPGGASSQAADSDEWRRRRARLKSTTIGRSGQPINARDVMHAAAIFYGLSVRDLTGSKRGGIAARARHVAAYLARRLTNASYPDLGEAFARDHSTIIGAVRHIEESLQTDGELRAEVAELERAVRSAHQPQLEAAE